MANANGASQGDEGQILQIIDENQQFTSRLQDYLEKWHLAHAGFNYHILSVFGSQSTGKSTLLNRVFGTDFDVMNENDRRQTTKGIWMSKGVDMDVLVMDVEGTDGRERGEDQDFERKSALFSMASAEVILVNLWEHQIGLYQGANMGLLKTVMEVNLSLFQAASTKSKDKTLLLFVIRDFIGSTPLENLQKTLQTDLEKLWSGLSKPPGLEESKIADYFDMEFDTLPHKILQTDLFNSRVLEIRQRFADPTSPLYVFKPIYHKRVPADGVPAYMSTIWQQILSNKDLDLPTQQELLAQFRCDEIASVVFKAFDLVILPRKQPIASGTHIDGLGEIMNKARSAALTEFDASASRYHAAVYQRKRSELTSKLNASLSPLYLGQLKNLHFVILAEFKNSLKKGLSGSEQYDFGRIVQDARKVAEERFVSEAESLILNDTDWSYQDSLKLLQDDLDEVAVTFRAQETKKMVDTIEKTLKKQISEPVELALNIPDHDMWDRLLTSYQEALAKNSANYSKKAASFNCTEDENATALALLRSKAWIALRSKIDEQTTDSTMLVKLKLAFEDRFRYDAVGMPRVWKPTDDIDETFKIAKDQTLALIPLYSNIAPADSTLLPDLTKLKENEDDEPPSFQIFKDSKVADLANRFRREADAYYIEAKRSLVSSISQVPTWIYLVMIILGWNEFVTVLRSPIYFTFLAIAGAACYVVYSLGMAKSVFRILQGASDSALDVARDMLRDFVSPQPNHSQRLAPAHINNREPETIELQEKKDL